jgi:hypothetical protein
VQGLESGTAQPGYLAIGNSFTDIYNGPFTLDDVLPGTTDLVASRLDAPPKTIIRRGVDFPNGAAIPLLDFGSIESIWLEPHTLTINGANINYFAAKSQVVTQRGTAGLLSEEFGRDANAARSVTMYSVPENRLSNDEMQFFSVDPEDNRYAMVFFHHPADQTVTLGPAPATATGTHSGTAPNLTLRLDLPSQPEYGAQVTFSLCLGDGGYYSAGTEISLLVTKEYFGGAPPTWSVNVPDLTSVQGYPGGDIRAANLCSMSWLTNVPFVFSPRATHDGDVFTTVANESNVVNK